ncbi:MAG: FecR domain-containing protein [Polyangiaceae bacterium]|nr:FecR domain-containing protein [Polyangiaceae bacterium]
MTRDSVRAALDSWRAQGVPVDEARRERLRDSTVDQIREAMRTATAARRRRSWLTGALLAALIGVGTAIAVVGAASALDWRGRTAASTPTLRGEVFVRGGDAEAEVRRGNQRLGLEGEVLTLEAGDTVRAGPSAVVELGLPNSGQGTLDRHSELVVTRAFHSEQHFVLRHGGLAVSIPPDSPHRSLVVTTPQADVSVVGTVFVVRVLDEEATTVTEVVVERGRVRVMPRQGSELWLEAGDHWRSDRMGDSPEALPAEDGATTSGAAPSPEATKGMGGGSAAMANGRAHAARQAAMAASTLAEQNRIYRAALDARNSGDDAQAVSLLDTLIARFPSSPLRQEAEVERFRALARIGKTTEATRAARRYLSAYDMGFARDEAEMLALPSAQQNPPPPP